jgi:large conductance mechanosensitive channel
MFKEFREFAIKGNVVDMAVGIMIGGAFATVIKSLVEDVVMPPISVATGGLDYSQRFIVLEAGSKAPPPYLTLEAAQEAGAITLRYGTFLNNVITFFIVALALFFLVRWINRLRRPDTPPAPTTRPCPFCKSHVDQEATRCAHCTSELEPESAAA